MSLLAFNVPAIPSQLDFREHWTDLSGRLLGTGSVLKNTTCVSDDKKRTLAGTHPIYVSDPIKPVICHTLSSGRLGNHLFEYASILGIGATTNKTFFFTNVGRLGRVLKQPPVQTDLRNMQQRCGSAQKKEHLKDGWSSRFDRKLVQLEPGRDYFIGVHLQSWLYFYGIEEDVRLAVTFNDEIVRGAKRVVGDIRKRFPGTTLVGVHVRRGDITRTRLITRGYLTAPSEYFKKAMTYFRRRFKRVTFVVLGQDRKWMRDNIPVVNNDTVFPAPGSPAVDMEILSRTDHLVTSVGTFSWWAAFKMPGRPTVVYLKDFFKPQSVLSAKYSDNAQDYMLPRWIAM